MNNQNPLVTILSADLNSTKSLYPDISKYKLLDKYVKKEPTTSTFKESNQAKDYYQFLKEKFYKPKEVKANQVLDSNSQNINKFTSNKEKEIIGLNKNTNTINLTKETKNKIQTEIKEITNAYLYSELGVLNINFDKHEEEFRKNHINTNLNELDKHKIYLGLNKVPNAVNKKFYSSIGTWKNSERENSSGDLKPNYSHKVFHENKQDFYFNDPLVSCQLLKINKQVFDKSLNHLLKTQIDMYKQTSNSHKLEEEKINKVKNVRVIVSTNKDKQNELTQPKLVDVDSKEKIGQVTKFSHHYRHLQFSELEMKGLVVYNNKSKPSSRAEFTMNVFNNYIYVIAGFSTERLMEVWVCDLKNNFEWINLHPDGETVNPRMGHSCVIYKNYMYIFGGNLKKTVTMPKEDIAMYNISKFIVLKNNIINLDNLLN